MHDFSFVVVPHPPQCDNAAQVARDWKANGHALDFAMRPTPNQVTLALDAAASGDPAAGDQLLPLVYEELRVLARQRLSREGAGLTLQPTALVHEAYLRLLGEPLTSNDGSATPSSRWNSRGHFFAAAAQAMRRILTERARRVASIKRGGGAHPLDLADLDASQPEALANGHTIDVIDQREQLISLDRALQTLEQRDPRKARIVMLRFFAGLSIEQTAAAMDLSIATVKNEWRFARAWLHSEMSLPAGGSAASSV
jgi:RNA polymerase sigma factor (TIGR02999 family)